MSSTTRSTELSQSHFMFYINSGYKFLQKSQKTVLEIGFGTGLNCLLTALVSEEEGTPTTFISIEKYPLPETIICQLNYPDLIGKNAAGVFCKIHDAKWGETVKISATFTVIKINLDITTQSLPDLPLSDVIYFDAFGPDKQPEMWELPVLEKATAKATPGTVFVTYSVKGVIRRRLKALGFQTEKLPGPPGKKEILRGIKI